MLKKLIQNSDGKTQLLKFLTYIRYNNYNKCFFRLFAGKGIKNLYPIDGYIKLNSDNTNFEIFIIQINKKNNIWVNKGYKRDGYKWLQQQNDLGYGIYIVPNGEGRRDEEIKTVSSLFVDFDYGTKEKQLEKINNFKLKPSFLI